MDNFWFKCWMTLKARHPEAKDIMNRIELSIANIPFEIQNTIVNPVDFTEPTDLEELQEDAKQIL